MVKKKVKKVVVKAKKAPKVDSRDVVFKRLLTDPKLPTYEEYELGGRDALRYAGEFEKDHKEEMVKHAIGMTSLMKANKNKHDDWEQG